MKMKNIENLFHGAGTSRSYKREGFTLLELLIVIGIIGVLMALATVAYSSAQVSGRNARRKQDLVAIQNALEQYYSENSFIYPNGTCKDASTYMKSAWPIDPNTLVDYDGVDDCLTSTYCVCATMESTAQQAATSGNSGANCSWTDKTHYCVGNLQ